MTRAKEFACWTALAALAAFGLVSSIAADDTHVTHRAVSTAQHGPVCSAPR